MNVIIDFDFRVGDEVILLAPDTPDNRNFSAGWDSFMSKYVGKVATIVDTGALHHRRADDVEVMDYQVAPAGTAGTWWWDADYMRPLVEPDAGLTQGFDLVFD